MRPLLLTGHTRPISSVVFLPEGDFFVSTGKDGKATLWRTENGERMGTYEGHRGAINHCALTKDGRILVTAGADEKVCVFNEGQLNVLQLKRHFFLQHGNQGTLFEFLRLQNILKHQPQKQLHIEFFYQFVQ